MGSADPPPGKMDEKLKSENMQKRAVFYVYVICWEQSGQADVENGAMLTTYLFRYIYWCTQARKVTHGLDGQHQDVDRTLHGRVIQNDRGRG